MNVEYKRDLTHNYMIVKSEENIDMSEFQIRMLLSNSIEGLLSCKVQAIDNEQYLYYDITAKQSLNSLYELRKFHYKELEMVLDHLLYAIEQTQEYLLNMEDLVLLPEYMYLNLETKELSLCYIPNKGSNTMKGIQGLMEYLLPKIDHKDQEAVALGYAVYRRTLEDDFHIQSLKEELYKRETTLQSNCVSKHETLFEVKYKNENQHENEITKIKTSKDEHNQVYNWEEQQKQLSVEALESLCLEESRECGGTDVYKAFIVPFIMVIFIGVMYSLQMLHLVSVEVLIALLIISTILNIGGYIWWKRKSTNKQSQKEDKESNGFNHQQRKEGDEENNILMSFNENEGQLCTTSRRDECEHIPCTKAGETTLLNTLHQSKCNLLKAITPENYPSIVLDRDVTILGKLEGAVDILIPMPTISRIHAKITRKDGKCYIMDMNSRNGTYVNQELLIGKKEVGLEVGDRVALADVIYQFVS